MDDWLWGWVRGDGQLTADGLGALSRRKRLGIRARNSESLLHGRQAVIFCPSLTDPASVASERVAGMRLRGSERRVKRQKRPEASGRFRCPPQGCTAVPLRVCALSETAVQAYVDRSQRRTQSTFARLSVCTIMSKIRIGTRRSALSGLRHLRLATRPMRRMSSIKKPPRLTTSQHPAEGPEVSRLVPQAPGHHCRMNSH